MMILIGGNAILARTMTIGDFVMYLFFTGMMAAPVVQMASIGTQITEAFAGLDRIREVKQTLAEDAEDASKASLDDAARRGRVRPRVVRVQPGRAGAEGHHVHARRPGRRRRWSARAAPARARWSAW